MRKFLTLLFFVFVCFLKFSYAQFGISPPILKIEGLKTGNSYLYSFKVLGNSEYANVYVKNGNIDYLIKTNYIQNYSEEDISNWISFVENPVKIEKGERVGEGKVNIIITVPNDAEPGYKLAFIGAQPVQQFLPNGTVSIAIIPSVEAPLIMQIDGIAIRDFEVFDIKSNYNDILIGIKNVGTVSASFYLILNISNSTFSKQIKSNILKFKPGETKVIPISLSSLADGKYNISLTIDFFSGKKFYQKEIYLESIKPLKIKIVEKVFDYSVILIILIIVLVIVIWKKIKEFK